MPPGKWPKGRVEEGGGVEWAHLLEFVSQDLNLLFILVLFLGVLLVRWERCMQSENGMF